MRHYIDIVSEDIDISNDRRKPRMMTEKKVLYRSISIPELIDIWNKGAVTGGGNRFAAEFHEDRTYVFFGDTLNVELKWQGEEIDRQAVHALSRHEFHGEWKELRAWETDLIQEQRELVHAELLKVRGRYEEEARSILAKCADNPDGMVHLGRNVISIEGRAKLRELSGLIEHTRKRLGELQKQFRELHGDKMGELQAWRDTMPFTSAVLVTKPISGGVQYSKDWGQSGMTQDEYGFLPGIVTLTDLQKILILKNNGKRGKEFDADVVQEIDPYHLGEFLKEKGLAAP